MAQGSAKKRSTDHGDLTGLADDDHSFYPKGVLGYAEVTASQTGITTETDLTGLSVTVDVAANRRIRITGQGLMLSDTADDIAGITIYEGATRLQPFRTHLGLASENYTVGGSVVETPSEGSHTYKLTGHRETGSGTLTLTATPTAPAFILVEDIGPA